MACDNGSEGEPDEHGYAKAQTTIPTFEPERLSVVWTSLPVDLMYAILDLAYQAELAGQAVSAALDNDSPPDFSEYFEERQLQFATLGLHAADVAAQLREHANLPTRSGGAWDPVAMMNKRQSTILEHRAQAAADLSRSFPRRSPLNEPSVCRSTPDGGSLGALNTNAVHLQAP